MIRTRHILLFIAIAIGVLVEAFAQVEPDSKLYRTIVELDKEYFDAYNECDMETQARLLNEDLEFYHDMGGVSTDKDEVVESIRQNICGKVSRELVPDSFEVHEIKDFGAVAMGYHKFFNSEEPDAISTPSRFVVVYKNDNSTWSIYRVISLH